MTSTSRSLGHRAPLLWIVLPFIAGLAAGKSGLPGQAGWWLGAALPCAIAALVAATRAPRFWPPTIVGAMLLAGLASYSLHRARLPVWDNLPPREVRLSLRVERVFAPADVRRTSGLATISTRAGHLRELTGQRVDFSLTLARGDVPPIRSAVISTVGVLVTLPRDPPADTFEGYLAGAGINFRLIRGRVLTEEQPAHAYYRFCAHAAAWSNEVFGRGIATKRPELTSLLRAMMLGTTHELSTEQRTLFMQSGTMHLFAISGLNIGVIAAALQALLMLGRLPRWAQFALGTALLWLFVDITGASPSAVRAFAMAVFLQAAFVLRRPGNVLAAIVMSAFAVLLISPLQVFSASFLMSYAIVVTLLVLGLPLADAWLARWIPWRDLPQATWGWWQHAIDYAWRSAASALAIGVATTLMSLLTGVQFFRLLTPGSLVANLVLIPAAVVVTLGGFGALLCALVGFGFGAALCNNAAALVLLGIERVVRLSVQVPGAHVGAIFTDPWIGPIALGLLLVALVFGYATDWKLRRGGWWPPFAIVALVLIFGVRFE